MTTSTSSTLLLLFLVKVNHPHYQSITKIWSSQSHLVYATQCLKIIFKSHTTTNDTFLHRKRISPRKLFLGQGKVFPRAVFNPPRVGLYIPSEARAVIETQGGLKTARGYTFVWPRSNFQGEILLWSRMVLSFILAGIQTASECLEQPLKAKKYPQKMRQKMRQEMNFPGKKLP